MNANKETDCQEIYSKKKMLKDVLQKEMKTKQNKTIILEENFKSE